MTGRAYRVRFREKAWRGWSPDVAPSRPLAPRCGRVLALDGRYERGGEPGDPGDPPRCGRPAGHPPAANGSPGCRSAQFLARERLKDLARNAAWKRGRRERARQAARRAVLAEALRGFDCDGWRHAT